MLRAEWVGLRHEAQRLQRMLYLYGFASPYANLTTPKTSFGAIRRAIYAPRLKHSRTDSTKPLGETIIVTNQNLIKNKRPPNQPNVDNAKI